MSADPFWNSVLLAAHLDGIEGGVVFTDVKAGRVITPNGGVVTSYANPLFGKATAVFSGASQYLAVPDSPSWFFDTAPFSISAWVRFASLSGEQPIVIQHSFGSAAGFRLYYTANTLRFTVGPSEVSRSFTPVLGTFYYIEAVRDGAAARIFVDGTKLGTDQSIGAATAVPNSAANLNIGRNANPSHFSGNIAEVLITAAARHGENYTPPAGAFPNNSTAISGAVRNAAGDFAARTVRAYDRVTGALVGAAVSSAVDGSFSIAPATINQCYVVAIDDDAGDDYNALIFDRITPV